MSHFYKTQEALQSYDWNAEKCVADSFFNPSEHVITWQCNDLCNFNCNYCGHYTKEHPGVAKYSNDHIAECFNKSGKSWHIIISGGEPFMRKGFVDLLVKLTQNHYVSLNTNLSLDAVYEFAKVVSPGRVIMINAGIHKNQRPFGSAEMDKFIQRYVHLHEKGFNIVGSFVVYPDVVETLADDISWLKSKGVSEVCAKTFYGDYKKMKYPEAYSAEEMKIIEPLMHGQIDMMEYLKYIHYKGRPCATGRRFWAMDPAGNLTRCLSDPKDYGNFFEDSMITDNSDKLCRADECKCPYQGMLFSSAKKKTSFLKKIFGNS